MNKSESLKTRWANGTFRGTTGRKMPEEEKRHHSESLKGRMPKNIAMLNANKKGSGNPMWGKPSSKKQKEAASKTLLNIWNDPVKSLALRQKLSLGQKGERGSNWKGGVSPVNKKIRRGIEFRLWREAVFARDNWTCQKYKIKGGKLHPHHIQNFAQFPELRFAIDNGITLSEKAHNEFHKKYGLKNNNSNQLDEFLYGN